MQREGTKTRNLFNFVTTYATIGVFFTELFAYIVSIYVITIGNTGTIGVSVADVFLCEFSLLVKVIATFFNW
jgi:hypothetical protein